LLSGVLTEIPGASVYFLGGIIAYHNDIKTLWLDIPEQVISTYGAVSAQTAQAMAKACRERFQADIAISITGIAGPGGGTLSKPVGLVYLAVEDENGGRVAERHLSGTRSEVRAQAVAEALKLVIAAAVARS